MPEIIKKVQDRRWVEYRRLELALQKPQPGSPAKPAEETSPVPSGHVVEVPDEKMTSPDSLIAAIRSLDPGDGADTEAVLAACRIQDADRILDNLMKEGEIFELTPGKIKVLE
jgi:hypothetical protein